MDSLRALPCASQNLLLPPSANSLLSAGVGNQGKMRNAFTPSSMAPLFKGASALAAVEEQ